MYRRIALVATNTIATRFGNIHHLFGKLGVLSTTALLTVEVLTWLLICQKGIWNTLTLDIRIYATFAC